MESGGPEKSRGESRSKSGRGFLPTLARQLTPQARREEPDDTTAAETTTSAAFFREFRDFRLLTLDFRLRVRCASFSLPIAIWIP